MVAERLLRVFVIGVLSIALVGCGGDSDDDSSADTTSDETSTDAGDASDDAGGDDDVEAASEDASEPESAEDASEPAAGGAVGGTLVIGDETIVLDSARCFLEEQDAAAGGGKILFVGQAFGVNAAGDDVVLDVSRYNEDSQFAGDDIIIDIGDFETGSSLNVTAEIGTIQLDGRTLSADGLTFTNFDDFSEVSGAFDFSC